MSVIGAAIGALGSLASGALTADAYNTQNSIAQSQFRENMQWQKQQYYDMKRWQSPKNQVRLYREAGINPALALESGLAGKVEGVGGVAPTSSMTSPDFSSIPSGAANLMQAFSQSNLSDTQAKNVEANTENTLIDNRTKYERQLEELRKLKTSRKLDQSQQKYYDAQEAFLNKQLQYIDERLEWENQSERFRAAGMSLDNTMKSLEIMFKPMQINAELQSLSALAFMNYQAGLASGASIEEIKARTNKEFAEYLKTLPEAEVGKAKANIYKNGSFMQKIGLYLSDKLFDALSMGVSAGASAAKVIK